MALGKVSRRKLIGALGGGVVAAPLLGRVGGAPGAAMAAPLTPADAEKILRPLAVGSRLARWKLIAVETHQGAITVTLRAESYPENVFHLEILARDRAALAARPPAETEHFAVFVRNAGDGWLPTQEEQGLAAMTLAAVIAKNDAPALADGLLTHGERIARGLVT